MVSLPSLALAVALSATGQVPADSSPDARLRGAEEGETVLIKFGAEWCGPCRQMQPLADALRAAGYPVRQIDADRNRELATRYQIKMLPTFVMVVDGREVDRVVGLTDRRRLEGMLARARVSHPHEKSRRSLAQSPDAGRLAPVRRPPAERPPVPEVRRPERLKTVQYEAVPVEGALVPLESSYPVEEIVPVEQAAAPVDPRLLKATVRIQVDDPESKSYGTGTIIDAREGSALVLTCGHLFRNSAGKGRITVELVGVPGSEPIEAQVIGYDLKRDVGFLSIRPPVAVGTVRLAAPTYRVAQGEQVTNIGCNGGDAPTVRNSHVTAVDRYLGPPNIEVAGAPRAGRSGGGLFNTQSELIGVCFAADRDKEEGVYAGLGAIHAELERLGLKAVVTTARAAGPRVPLPDRVAPVAPRQPMGPTVPTSGTRADVAPPVTPPPVAAPPLDAGSSLRGRTNGRTAGAAALAGLSPTEQAALEEIGERSRDAEVICIIRPLADSDKKSQILVLDRASPLFLETLSRSSTAGKQLTALKTPAGAQPRAERPQHARLPQSDHAWHGMR